MTKKRTRKNKSSFKNRLFALIGFVTTLFTGAGVGGWAWPDMPIVGQLVQRVLRQGDGEEPQLTQLGERIQSRRSDPDAVADGAAPLDSLPPGRGRFVSAVRNPLASTRDKITIASFNIQVFGTSKMAKTNVMQCLVDVVRKFDLVAIQEVRSSDQTIIPEFVRMINANGRRYAHVLGPRLGRTSSKEQYVFVYDTECIELWPSSVLTMSDPQDVLHREPLVARFRVRTANPDQGFTFWLMNAHTDPDEVKTEVDGLAEAYVSIQQDGWGEDDVILLGDLNANERQLGQLGELPGMQYAISQIPTNTRGTKTYDNILFDGRTTVEYTGASGVLDLMKEYRLSMEQALEVSDHLPVWATFSAYEGQSGTSVAERRLSAQR